ncbi:MAG: hypothetical protein ACE5HS_01390 [bacterium]
MDSTLTLLGSIVIGGLFMLGLMTFYGGVIDNSYVKTLELLTQETSASFLEIIEHDFRRIGSAVQIPANAILDTSEITFLGDIDENGSADTVRYYTSTTSLVGSTPNSNDVILYRVVNGVNTLDAVAGVTEFDVAFLDETGHRTTDLAMVRTLEVSLMVESIMDYNGKYSRAFWKKRFTPRSLNRITRTDY